MIPTFVGVTFMAFLIMHLAPGDPVEMYFHGGLAAGVQGASPERLAEIQRAKQQERHRLGLDRPLPVQYAIWFKRLVTLDLGESFKDRRQVWDKIRERLPVTIALNVNDPSVPGVPLIAPLPAKLKPSGNPPPE